MPLFAQLQQLPNDELDPVLITFVGVGCGILLLIRFFYCRTLSIALQRCRPRNRTMQPGLAYLNLVPVLHLVWQFIAVIRVAESLKNEFYDRGWDDREDFGRGIGIAFSSLDVVGLILPCIGPVFSLGGLVCWIVHWVKIAGYNAALASRPWVDDDDDDDLPRGRWLRRSRRDDDDYDDRR